MSNNYENFQSEQYTYEGGSKPLYAEEESSSSVFADSEVRAHFTTFAVIIGMLFAIDYLTGGGFWFQYVAISWGIGVSIHFWDTYFNLHVKNALKRDLLVHAAVEFTLIGFFLLMDYFTSPRLTWFMYPSLPLAFAWACHFGSYLYRSPSGDGDADEWSSRYHRMVEHEKHHLGKEDNLRIRYLARQIVVHKLSFRIHFVVYLAAIGFFFGLNYFTNPNNMWFYWPVLPWGLGVYMHYFGSHFEVQRYRGRKVSKFYHAFYPLGVCLFLMAIDFLTGNGLSWYIYPCLPIMGITIFVLLLVPQQKAQPILAPIDHYIETDARNIPHSQSGIEVEVTFDNLYEKDKPKMVQSIENQGNTKPVRFCAKCGAPVSNHYKYCEYCGAHIRQD